MVSGEQALERLREGNRRFVAERRSGVTDTRTRLREVADGQAPFAVILGCSDSRVPAEIVFDQGLGDLFVIRVVGNIVAPSQIGSVEFAATQLGTRLVVVLGHSKCGAIQDALWQLQGSAEERSRNLRSITDFVRPSVESVLQANPDADPDALVAKAVRANVRKSAQQLRQGSAILEELERDSGLVIVGAEYSLDTGCVDFLDDVPRHEE